MQSKSLTGCYADKIYWGNTFITFTAKADIDVFIMKHEKSRSDLSAWTLVEEDFPVEPKVYFKGGADIYTRSYKQGGTVIIPGSNAQAGGWGNLVFVRYAQGNYIRIISPHPEDQLKASTKKRYCAVMLGLEYDTVQWHKRIGDGEWEELGTGLSGEMTVPFVETTTIMKLKASLYDETGEFVADRVAAYEIMDDLQLMPNVITTPPVPGGMPPEAGEEYGTKGINFGKEVEKWKARLPAINSIPWPPGWQEQDGDDEQDWSNYGKGGKR